MLHQLQEISTVIIWILQLPALVLKLEGNQGHGGWDFLTVRWLVGLLPKKGVVSVHNGSHEIDVERMKSEGRR